MSKNEANERIVKQEVRSMAADRNEKGLKETEPKAAGSGPKEKESGYCPYTPDRRCKTGKGGWSDSEECRECGWRAW